jgi:hypothetical protein
VYPMPEGRWKVKCHLTCPISFVTFLWLFSDENICSPYLFRIRSRWKGSIGAKLLSIIYWTYTPECVACIREWDMNGTILCDIQIVVGR